MSVVAGSDIFTNTWNTFYKIISGNVVDTGSRGGSAWIFADYPMIQEGKEDKHPGFPIITIDSFENSGNLYTFNKIQNTLSSMVTIHSRNKRHLDVISSDVHDAIVSNRKVLGSSGLHNLQFTPGGTETYAEDRYNKTHMKMMGIQVDTVL